ncbi:CHASE2 domain-containing protein [Anabaena sp. WFMT]|uniref:CHASE2 domain-containing protein n=1 Tax=Anabaena sp. WFMT TaxID=3449730 RepID=UPI003F24F66D
MPCAVIITAIRLEYEAVCRHISNLKEETYKGMVYGRGRFFANGNWWTVGIVETGAGNVNAGLKAERAIAYFQPNVILFVGVAGGIKDVKLGDVVAATKVYGYESGKETDSNFQTRPEVGRSTNDLVERAKAEARKSDWLKRLKSIEKSKQDIVADPKVYVEPIASGEKVIASKESPLYQFIRNSYNDAIAVEMEGRGVLEAAYANQQVSAIVIRGISDLLVGKGEADAAGSQEIAALRASAFAFEVLSKLEPNPVLKIGSITLLTTIVVSIIRLLGVFQPLELLYFDQMVRMQGSQDSDERLVIVEITEENINKYAEEYAKQNKQSNKSGPDATHNKQNNIYQYNPGASLPDQIIEKLLRKLLDKKTTVIGLDIYRPYDNKLKSLADEFKKKGTEIVFICKFPDAENKTSGQNPPPDVSVDERVGLSDFIDDYDGITRRQIIRMGTNSNEYEHKKSKCKPFDYQKTPMESFSFKVTQKYLYATNQRKYEIIQNLDKNSRIYHEKDKNKIELQPLDQNVKGGYHLKEIGGFHILLRYRFAKKGNEKYSVRNIAHKTYSVDDVLNSDSSSDFNKLDLKDKIVLIGTPVESYDNIVPTPFSDEGQNSPVYGLYIQGQMISQLVSAALDQKPLLKAGTLDKEILLIFIFSLIGSILAQLFKESLKTLVIIVSANFFAYYLFCLVMFFQFHTWLSLISPVAGLLLASGSMTILVDMKFILRKNNS